MDAWLTAAADALARASGTERERLELDDATVTELLDLARVAAHESGDRKNAPLLCYLAGLAAAGAPLADLADAVRRSSS